MAGPQYRFLDEWRLPVDVERVYELISRPLEYPRWWGQVFVAAEGDGGEAAPGKKVTVKARGFLPYHLRFSLTCLETDKPYRIHSRLDGDFEGTGTWLLQADGDGRARPARLAAVGEQDGRQAAVAGVAAAVPLEPQLDDAPR